MRRARVPEGGSAAGAQGKKKLNHPHEQKTLWAQRARQPWPPAKHHQTAKMHSNLSEKPLGKKFQGGRIDRGHLHRTPKGNPRLKRT